MPLTPADFDALNTTDFGAWLAVVNSLAGGWMGAVILLIVYTGTLVTLKASAINRTSDCFAAAGFVTWAVASMLLLIPMISLTLWAASMSLMILGAMWVWLEGR